MRNAFFIKGGSDMRTALRLVLGDMAELSLRRALLLAGGSPLGLVSSPISAVLLAGALLSIVYPLFKKPKMLQGM
jgi:putative tricarboxylic transport membrane protein